MKNDKHPPVNPVNPESTEHTSDSSSQPTSSDETGRQILKFATPSDIDNPIYAGVPSWSRTYNINVNSEQHFVKAIEALISIIINIHGGTRQSAIKHIFTAGLKVMAEDSTYSTNEVRVPLEIATFLANARSRANFIKELKKISDTLGEDELLAMAQESGFDPELLFETLKRAPGNSSWWDSATRWLREYLSDCQEHSIEEIQLQAKLAGILSSPTEEHDAYDREWGNLKTIATKAMYSKTGKRGTWKAPCDEQQENREVS